jgi:hypothetical protein
VTAKPNIQNQSPRETPVSVRQCFGACHAQEENIAVIVMILIQNSNSEFKSSYFSLLTFHSKKHYGFLEIIKERSFCPPFEKFKLASSALFLPSSTGFSS